MNQLYQKLFIAVLAVVVFGACYAGDKDVVRDTRKPSRDLADMLERFVAECLQIRPGEGHFPKSLIVKNRGAKDGGESDGVALKPFRVCRYETTQELYAAVMGQNPSRWKGPRNSVETISFADAATFCEKLTAQLRDRKLIAADQLVRLPTSVEWEYCCRAGTSTIFSFGDDAGDGDDTRRLDQYAWHTGNAAGNDPAVGVLKPNPWGLYDCHGYLWEFVEDRELPRESDGRAPVVIRGGSWKDHHSRLSSSSYLTIPSESVSDAIGFRCVIAQDTIVKNGNQQ